VATTAKTSAGLEVQAAHSASTVTENSTAPPTISERLKDARALSADWLGRNAVSFICIGIAGAVIWCASTMGGTDATANFNRKWIIFAALMFAIAGWVAGTKRPSLHQEVAIALVLWVIAGFALYAGLIDAEWQKGALGNRVAACAFAFGIVVVSVTELSVMPHRTRVIGTAFVSLWTLGWALYFLNCPSDMALDVGSAYASALIYLVLVVIAGGGIGLVTLTSDGTGGQTPERPTTVAHSKNAKPRHIFQFGITSDDDETEG
jgi:hypothetical protein